MPNASDDFVHRIGRTGRAGAKGVATTFVMPQEKSDARKLERELKIKFEWREADKNLEKEERNKPLDLNTANNDLMALETRSWRSGDAARPGPALRRLGRATVAAADRAARVGPRRANGGSGHSSGRPGGNRGSGQPGRSRSGGRPGSHAAQTKRIQQSSPPLSPRSQPAAGRTFARAAVHLNGQCRNRLPPPTASTRLFTTRRSSCCASCSLASPV